MITTSSLLGANHLRQTTQLDGVSQVSGHGSILHQFITEGVEEDTIIDDISQEGDDGNN